MTLSCGLQSRNWKLYTSTLISLNCDYDRAI